MISSTPPALAYSRLRLRGINWIQRSPVDDGETRMQICGRLQLKVVLFHRALSPASPPRAHVPAAIYSPRIATRVVPGRFPCFFVPEVRLASRVDDLLPGARAPPPRALHPRVFMQPRGGSEATWESFQPRPTPAAAARSTAPWSYEAINLNPRPKAQKHKAPSEASIKCSYNKHHTHINTNRGEPLSEFSGLPRLEVRAASGEPWGRGGRASGPLRAPACPRRLRQERAPSRLLAQLRRWLCHRRRDQRSSHQGRYLCF